jgi:hypothetical protein
MNDAPSLRERILQAALDAVRASLDGLAVAVLREPAAALSRDQCPALVLHAESESVTYRSNDRAARELTLRLVAITRAVPPASPQMLADQLITRAHAALMALMADVTLGGLALSLRELDTEWDVEDADALACAVTARYQVSYRTLAADLRIAG